MSGTKQDYPFFSLLVNSVLEVPASANWQDLKKKKLKASRLDRKKQNVFIDRQHKLLCRKSDGTDKKNTTIINNLL